MAAVALSHLFMVTASAQVRPLKDDDPDILTLGCVPRQTEFDLYYSTDRTFKSAEIDIETFPAGLASRLERQGNYSLSVNEILTKGRIQILRGTVSDGRGFLLSGEYFVFARQWNCRLFVKGGPVC